jgi:formylglycine-generating enzyme required for sulfatase activity
VKVAEPDGKAKTTLIATLDGYRTLRKELQPAAGESRTIALRLERTTEKPVAGTPSRPKTAVDQGSAENMAATREETGSPSFLVAPFDAQAAQEAQQCWARYLKTEIILTNCIGMEFALIPPGTFDMGCTDIEVARAIDDVKGRKDADWYQQHLPAQAPKHRVKITRPFYLGLTEVTQHQYELVAGTNPSKFKGDSSRPVEQVTWDEAVDFCQKLGKMSLRQSACRECRLPTEAEWEYACRAGTVSLYGFGDDQTLLSQFAWWNTGLQEARTNPVGQLRPNVWGLCDMHGNVWERCSDWYATDYYRRSPLDDPGGPESGPSHVIRGGSWGSSCSVELRCAHRTFIAADRGPSTGFRVAMTVAHVPSAAERTDAGGPSSNMPALPADCVVAYSFDRDTIFSQGSQQYVRDLSGHNYHGLLNNVEIVDGKVGTAAKFAGKADSYVKLPDENGQYPANDLTVMAWVSVSPDAPPSLESDERSHRGTVLDLNFASSSVGVQNGGVLFAIDSHTYLGLHFSTGPRDVWSETPGWGATKIARGQWTHIAATRKGEMVALFLNGVLDKQHSASAGPIVYKYAGYDDDSVSIGIFKRVGITGWQYWGRIDEFALFDRALSEQEIADMCQGRVGSASGFAGSAYLVNRRASGITRTPLTSTIQSDGIALTADQLKAVEAKDGVCLEAGFYHLFKFPNRGLTHVEWTGYGSGNAQILVHYWDGSRMVAKDIRGASELATHRIPVSVPASEPYVYVMVNCTGGTVFTDAITVGGG